MSLSTMTSLFGFTAALVAEIIFGAPPGSDAQAGGQRSSSGLRPVA